MTDELVPHKKFQHRPDLALGCSPRPNIYTNLHFKIYLSFQETFRDLVEGAL